MTRPAVGEVLVRILRPADNLGRVRYVAHWLDPTVPGGVRGQCCFATLATEEADATRQGMRVRVVCEAERHPVGAEQLSLLDVA